MQILGHVLFISNNYIENLFQNTVPAWKTISANPEIWSDCLLTWRGSWLCRNLESKIFRVGCCSVFSLVLVILGVIFPPFNNADFCLCPFGVYFLHLRFMSLYVVCPSVISTAVAWVDDEFIAWVWVVSGHLQTEGNTFLSSITLLPLFSSFL